MKHNYQKLFWMWTGLAVAYAMFMAFGGRIALSRSTDHFFQFSISYFNFFVFFPIGFAFFDLRWMERMSSKIREVLSFEEYFDLKRSLKLTLTTQDRDYAKEKLDKDASTDIPASRWLLMILVIVNFFSLYFFSLFMNFYQFLPHSIS